jgi:adenylate kinase
MKRTPTPKYQHLKNLENLAMSAAKLNKNLRVHIVCSGMPYGNGESNEVFYEFFRRAWLSLHPDLAALPVIDGGNNYLPTIHVTDLARCIRSLVEEEPGKKFVPSPKQYLIAVDKCANSSQRAIMSSISAGLGNGAVSEVPLATVLHEEWAEFLTINLRLQMSEEFACLDAKDWHCIDGISLQTIQLLNEEFNMFRGLFPLKVYVGGPPASGKSHYASKMAESYGIPHLTIKEMVDNAKKEQSDLGNAVRTKIEEMKDQVLEDYEKTRKKKDPDLVRDDIKTRIPDDMVHKIVKSRIESPACMNKGFVLDGYPRNIKDAKAVFYEPIPGYEPPEDEEQKKPDDGLSLNEKILPQYTVIIDAEDAFLKARMKEMPEVSQGTHWEDKEMDRRLKIYREANGG